MNNLLNTDEDVCEECLEYTCEHKFSELFILPFIRNQLWFLKDCLFINYQHVFLLHIYLILAKMVLVFAVPLENKFFLHNYI